MKSHPTPDERRQVSAARALNIRGRLQQLLANDAWRVAMIAFLSLRVFLSLWGILVLSIRPIPEDPDPIIYPYLGDVPLREGLSGALLGPWQRFDTMHYLRIADTGYKAVEDSVFPPLYPLLIRYVGLPLQLFFPSGHANLLAGIIISNVSFFGALILLYRLAAVSVGSQAAQRTIVYLIVFPTAFFFFAPYTESLFLFLVLSVFWASQHRRYWAAGFLGLLAALTRLNGWLLSIVLAYQIWKRRQEILSKAQGAWRAISPGLAASMPALGAIGFILWRQSAQLPSLAEVYRRFWLQTAAIPGKDIIILLQRIVAGGAAFSRIFDFLIVVFLITMSILVFRHLGTVYGLYCALMLVFILLPTSQEKPLFSFSRYALIFFPIFIVLGLAGRRPWLNRLILYPFVGLFLYFAGQFFMWGWVA